MSHINSPKHLGKAAIYTKNDLDIIHGMNLLGIRPIKSEVIPKYLNYYFLSKDFDSYIKSISNQSVNQASFAASKLKNLEIPLPSLSEQKTIVAKLDRAQRLIDIDKEMLAKYDELIQSVFLEMFGDPVKNDKEWDTLKLGDYCNVVRGSSPRPKGDPRYFDGPVPRLMVEDVTRDGMYVTPQIDSLTEEGAEKSRWMKKGDVVVAASGKPGVPTILQVNCCIHDGFIGLRDLSEEINSRFLYFFFYNISKEIGQRSDGAIFKNITTTNVKNLEIFKVPLETQQQFAEKAKKIRTEIISIRKQLKKSEELFSSLVQGAFE
jgi:restriction endonuclease S subunit